MRLFKKKKKDDGIKIDFIIKKIVAEEAEHNCVDEIRVFLDGYYLGYKDSIETIITYLILNEIVCIITRLHETKYCYWNNDDNCGVEFAIIKIKKLLNESIL